MTQLCFETWDSQLGITEPPYGKSDYPWVSVLWRERGN